MELAINTSKLPPIEIAEGNLMRMKKVERRTRRMVSSEQFQSTSASRKKAFFPTVLLLVNLVFSAFRCFTCQIPIWTDMCQGVLHPRPRMCAKRTDICRTKLRTNQGYQFELLKYSNPMRLFMGGLFARGGDVTHTNQYITRIRSDHQRRFEIPLPYAFLLALPLVPLLPHPGSCRTDFIILREIPKHDDPSNYG